MIEKTCIECGVTSIESDFVKNKNICKICQNKRQREYYHNGGKENKLKQQKKYREDNKDKINKYRRTYYKLNRDKIINYNKKYKNPDKIKEYKQNNPDKVKECNKRYYYKNIDKIKEYRLKNSEKAIESTYDWRKNNPDKAKVLYRNEAHKRRLLVKITPEENGITLEEWEDILKYQNNICNMCKLPFDDISPTMDHIIPVSKGGLHTKENIQALCRSCNSKKGNKL